MSLEDILARITQDAESKRKAILERASLEAKTRLEKAEKEIQEEVDRLLERRKKEIEAEVQRKMAEAKLQSRHELGRVKTQSVNLLRERLTQLLFETIEKSYEKWCTKLLLRHIQSGDEEIWMFPYEAEKLGERFVHKMNTENNYHLKWGGIIANPSERGFVLKKKGMSFTLTFSAILDDFLKRNESAIVKNLFQGVEL